MYSKEVGFVIYEKCSIIDPCFGGARPFNMVFGQFSLEIQDLTQVVS